MKNNNSNGKPPAEANNRRLRKPPKYKFGGFMLIFLGIICYVSACRINSYSTYLIEIQTTESTQHMVEQSIKQDMDIWSEVVRYAKNLNRYYIYYRNYSQTPDSQKVKESDMAEDIAMVSENMNNGIDEAVENYNEVAINPLSTEEEKQQAREGFHLQIEELLRVYDVNINNVKATKLKDNNRNYNDISNHLQNTKEFVYYIRDDNLNRTFTNVVGNAEAYMASETYLNIDLNTLYDSFNGIPLNESFSQDGISGFIMIPKEQPVNSAIENALTQALTVKDSNQQRTRGFIIKYFILLAAAIMAIVLLLMRSIVPYFNESRDGFILLFKAYMKIPVLLKLILAVYAIANLGKVLFWSLDIIGMYHNDIIYTSMRLMHSYLVILITVFTAAYAVYVFKNLHSLKNEFEYRFIKTSFRDFAIAIKFSPALMPLILVLLIGAIGLFAGIFIYSFISLSKNFVVVIMMLICLCLCILMGGLLCICANYSKLGYYIKNIADGDLITVPNESGWFARPVNALNDLSEGMKKSLNEMLASERTKTELITNVSHDLKTPLTSIINYVDLLQKCNLPDTATREYVEILKQKSNRLRILIEDLFEAAKLSSHSMVLSAEVVDVIQLLKQAIGELSEKFENAELDIRFGTTSERILLLLDGKRMWRVFENLLNNIVNYSPMGSRVYITVTEDEKTIEITMKNISIFELDFDAAELFDRFKRGDSARTTEGSGLGLSISKDIVEMHGGRMDIVIDGDLFKVIITLNKME